MGLDNEAVGMGLVILGLAAVTIVTQRSNAAAAR